MWMGALMKDDQIYRYDYGNDEQINEINASETYEVEVAKIRYLLSILGPVAKHVLRNAPKPDSPSYNLLMINIDSRYTYMKIIV